MRRAHRQRRAVPDVQRGILDHRLGTGDRWRHNGPAGACRSTALPRAGHPAAQAREPNGDGSGDRRGGEGRHHDDRLKETIHAGRTNGSDKVPASQRKFWPGNAPGQRQRSRRRDGTRTNGCGSAPRQGPVDHGQDSPGRWRPHQGDGLQCHPRWPKVTHSTKVDWRSCVRLCRCFSLSAPETAC
jgi:hypothetical protein